MKQLSSSTIIGTKRKLPSSSTKEKNVVGEGEGGAKKSARSGAVLL
nr:hypothetical protein Iba_scaffold120988CG0010 [Ipomoea batatas]GMD43610.1 hypothetical protein Iba_scaffold120989CG0010 [Ipomoea batatas]